MGVLTNLTGRKFGQLTVLSHAGSSPSGVSRWHVACDCGNTKVVLSMNMKAGRTKSCGFCRCSNDAKTTVKTGALINRQIIPEYQCWLDMRKRCSNPNSKDYKHYGGRGISVCERWNSFANFIGDMGPRPAGMSLDRTNNNLGYEPSNCRWASKKEQMRNRRNTINLTAFGKTAPMADWAEEFGVHYWTLQSRVKSGMPVELALTKAVAK